MLRPHPCDVEQYRNELNDLQRVEFDNWYEGEDLFEFARLHKLPPPMYVTVLIIEGPDEVEVERNSADKLNAVIR